MNRLRVINLGLPKTGTTTLSKALKLSGMRVIDHKIRTRQTSDPDLRHAFTADQMYQGYFQTGDPLARLDEFDGFAEISILRGDGSLWPQTDWGVMAAIMAHHPGVKFVATWRDPFDVSQSMVKWGNMGLERVPNLNIPGLPEGYGQTTSERCQWISAHYDFLDRVFAGSDRYLRLPVADTDARERLASHLGCDIPWWGRANVNNEGAA